MASEAAQGLALPALVDASLLPSPAMPGAELSEASGIGRGHHDGSRLHAQLHSEDGVPAGEGFDADGDASSVGDAAAMGELDEWLSSDRDVAAAGRFADDGDDGIHPEVVEALAEGLSLGAEHIGLGDDSEKDKSEASGSAAEGGAASSSNACPDAPAANSGPQWQDLDGPGSLGYYYYRGRSVMRVVRGKPRNTVNLRCFQHPKCGLWFPLRNAPSDDEPFKRWLFSCREVTSADSREDRLALAQEHTEAARRLWSAKSMGY